MADGAALRDANGRAVDPESPLALRALRTNLVNVPADALCAESYNDEPRRLRIGATRSEHAALFEALDESPTRSARRTSSNSIWPSGSG